MNSKQKWAAASLSVLFQAWNKGLGTTGLVGIGEVDGKNPQERNTPPMCETIEREDHYPNTGFE
jgi:hypothetical protein